MKRIAEGLLCLALALLCAQAGAQGTDAPLSIAAGTDLHVNPAYRTTGIVNPLEPYHLQIVDAFLWDAARSGTDVLLLLGDITNQGKLAQHEALLEKLRAAQAAGMTVYVLPGNHDIGEVDPARFAQLYADFGYGGALSRDAASLSYTVVLENGLELLMLDTNGYSGHRDRAFLTEETLDWMRSQLEQAQAAGRQVIAAGHYPLLTQNSTPFEEKERAASLLEEYGVRLYLCGHLHKRCVAVQGALTELVVDQTISYPCAYAALSVEGRDAIRYRPHEIAVSEWARESGADDANLLAFDAYQSRLELERCRGVVARLKGEKETPAQEQRQAEDFFWQLSDARAHGTLSRYADALRAHPGYDVFVRLGEGTIYSRWTPSVLADAVPYTTGFALTGGGIQATEDGGM